MLPQLPDNRWYHTQESGLLCGGAYPGTSDTCLEFNSVTGNWGEKIRLTVGRSDHISWTPDSNIGTYLIGGDSDQSKNTSTLIPPEGGQEPGFPLKYETGYLQIYR